MHKLDQLFSNYTKRITFASVFVVLLGAPVWIGQIRVGNLLLLMKTTQDLFRLSDASIVSATFATRFLATYLSSAFTWQNLLTAVYQSLRFAEILWLLAIVYLATSFPEKKSHKAMRWSALAVFALQGILYIVVFYSLYSAYNAGSAAEATRLLSMLGLILITFSWIEVFLATLAALFAVFQLLRDENS
jgi:hypothetical protein